MQKILLAIGLILFILGLIWWMIVGKFEGLINPLSQFSNQNKKKSEFEVVGFLPSWMVGKTRMYGDELDELIFLGVEVSEEGKLVWDSQGKKINNEEYLKMKESVKRSGGKNILGIKQFDDKKLDKILGDQETRLKLINELQGVVAAGGFDGVNVDFEFQNNPTRVLEDDLASFLGELREVGVGHISVDVFANTIIKGNKEGLLRLLDVTDQVVVMGYDFHGSGSNFTGPVAPLNSPIGERNLMEVTNRLISDGLNKKKVILALPLYGYEWKTETADLGAKVLDWSQMASYARARELENDSRFKIQDLRTDKPENLEDLKVGEMRLYFDETSMSPWLTYKTEVTKTVYQRISKYSKKTKAVHVKEEQIFQVFYEDLKSLKLKFDLVKQTQLGGVGFWALGYEGEDRGVWDQVVEIFK